MGRLTPIQLVFLIALVMAFGLLTTLAIAKWRYEQKQAALRKEKAEQKRAAGLEPPKPTP